MEPAGVRKTAPPRPTGRRDFVGFTNQYAAANYIYDDSTSPSDLCSSPLRRCGDGNLYGGNEPARTWFTAMKPIATNFGDIHLPPTDREYVEGGPGSRVPSVAGLDVDAARQRLKDPASRSPNNPRRSTAARSRRGGRNRTQRADDPGCGHHHSNQ